MGCSPVSRSMIRRRWIPRPTRPSWKIPRESGPRCSRPAHIRAIRSRSTACPRGRSCPAMPHMPSYQRFAAPDSPGRALLRHAAQRPARSPRPEPPLVRGRGDPANSPYTIMQIANHFRRGRRPEFGLIALSAFVALVFAAYSFGAISSFPPKLTGRNFQIAGAASHVLVVAPPASSKSASASDFDALTVHADLLAKLMASQPVLDRVARRTGAPANQIAAVSPITENVDRVLKEPDSETRANEILLSTRKYRLDIQAKPTGSI